MSLKKYGHALYGCILVTSMLAFRMWFTHSNNYLFIEWNLLLAFVPFVVAASSYRLKLSSGKLLLATLAWLAFFPNSPYLVTDLYHLSHFKGMPAWYDALLLFTAAYTGLSLGFASLRLMEIQWIQVWEQRFFNEFSTVARWRWRLFITMLLFFATGFGIYLGRVLRYNSWDILFNSDGLATDIANRVSNPLQYLSTWGFSILYAAGLLFFYRGWPGIRSSKA